MKKYIGCMIVMLALVFSSCQKEQTSFDSSLLIGKWMSGTVHYKYLSDNTGTTWDTADDVTEAEGQPFTWTLVQSELTHIHIILGVESVPKVYTVTELTATTLKYEDSLGAKYSYTKSTN